MKRYLFLLITLLPLLGYAQEEGGVCYQQSDSLTICRLLDEAHSLPRTTNFPLFFARKFLGVPYVAYTLEVNDDERLVLNTRQLDCTTLVETVTALTLCAYRHLFTWRDYLNALTAMRYRNGRIEDYTSRIHYFTEWITLNTEAGIVKEIQEPNPPFSAVQNIKVNYMSQHPQSYKALREHPEYLDAIREMEKRVSGGRFQYIPKQMVKNQTLLRQAVNDGDIIAITCKKAAHDALPVSAAAQHPYGYQNYQNLKVELNQIEIMELPDFMSYANKFSQSEFVEKISRIAKRAGSKLVYAALILYYTLQSDSVSKTDKAIIIGALGYMISPLDVIPDAIPIAGLTDDFAVLIYVLKKVWTDVDPSIIEQAKEKLSKWFDEEEICDITDIFKDNNE